MKLGKIIILGLFLGVMTLFLSSKPAVSPTNKEEASKIYQNSKYGFQFTYPANWKTEAWDLEEATGYKTISDGTILYQGKFLGPSGRLDVLIWENKAGATVRQWLTWYRHEDLVLKDLPEKENDTIVGLPAIRYFQKETSRKTPTLFYFFKDKDKIFEIVMETEATNSAVLNSKTYGQILQSFKFMVK